MGVAGGSGLPAAAASAATSRAPPAPAAAGEATAATAAGNAASEACDTVATASATAGRGTSPPTAGAGSASAGGGAGDGERAGGAAGDCALPVRGRLSQPRGDSQPEPPVPAGFLAASAARALRMPASPGRRRGAPGGSPTASSPSPSDTVPLAADAAATSPGVHRTRWRGAPPVTECRESGRRRTERPAPSSAPSTPPGSAVRPVGGRRPARSAVDAGSAEV